jgi:DNA primase large subunit
MPIPTPKTLTMGASTLIDWTCEWWAIIESHVHLTYLSYDIPPLEDITLEDFEIWAIDRLRVLGEIESSLVRNRPYDEMRSVTTQQCKKYLPLNSSSAISVDRDEERRKDHVSHFILRLAFCRSCVFKLSDVGSYRWISVAVKNLDVVLSRRKWCCFALDSRLTITLSESILFKA